MSTNARNVAIVLALAAVVAFVPGGGVARAVLLQLLSILLFATLAFFAVRLYRGNRVALLSLPDRDRTMLYGALALAMWTLTATDRLWGSGAGTLVWFALMGLAVLGLYAVYRSSRQY